MDKYDLGQRVSNSNVAAAGQHQEPRIRVTGNYYKGPNMKFDAQEMSKKPSETMDNLRKQGVGVTSVGVKAKSVTNNYTGGASKRMYPVNVVNKAKAKIGGNSSVSA